MNSNIYLLSLEKLLHFIGPQPFEPRRRERDIRGLTFIAFGRDEAELDGEPWMGLYKQIPHLFALRNRQLASSGAKDDCFLHEVCRFVTTMGVVI